MPSRPATAVVTLFAFLLVTLPAGHALAQEPDPNAPPPPPTAAPPPDENLAVAKQHFEAGRDAYGRQDFAGAVREFKAAQAIRPSPILDYNIGLAYEALNRPKAAMKYYQRYLAEKPDAQNRPEVEQKLAALQQQAGGQPVAPPPGPGTPPEATGDDTGPAPPPVSPPQTYSGYDPYAGQGYGYQYPQQQQPPKKKRSYWWIVFPILGGVALIFLTIYLVWAAGQTTTYYATGASTLPPVHGGSTAAEPGVLFRF